MRSAPPCAATASPQWMLLAPHGGGFYEKCDITGDTKTMAAGSTSSGHRMVVSVSREPSSPALARICLCFQPETEIRIPGCDIIRAPNSMASAYYAVVAAHGGSVLVHITSTQYYLTPTALDYFVYTNMAGAGRPPSLLLLPPVPSPTEEGKLLDVYATGFLFHGEAEFVVAQLKMPPPEAKEDVDAEAMRPLPMAAELLLFRNGEWRVKRPSVVHRHGRDGDDQRLPAKWKPEAVVAVGDTVLCWVDFSHGVIFSDVFRQTDDDDVLWYVPYPAEAEGQCFFVCTNARGELKLVGVSPRRCSQCGCSQHASAVDTWTLDTDGKAWVLETAGTTTTSMVDDSTELWALEKHSRQHLVYPVPVASGMNGGGHVDSDESTAPTTMEQEDEHMAASGKWKKRRVSTSAPEATPGDVAQAGEHDVAQDKAREPGPRRSARQRRPSRRIHGTK